MSACGHSLWAVPSNYKELARKYNMKHIPHVSIEKGLPTTSHSPLVFGRCNIRYFKGLSNIKRDGIQCAGYYCEIKEVKPRPTELYMPIWYDYSGGYFNYLEPPEPVDALFLRANTESDDPTEWFLE